MKINHLLTLLFLALTYPSYAQTIVETQFWRRGNTLSKKLKAAGREVLHLDANGRPVLFYPNDGSDSHVVYYYDATGKLQREVTYAAHGDSSVKQYEPGGRVATEINYSGSRLAYHFKRYVYRSDGLPDTIYTTWTNKGDRVVNDQLIHLYDGQGRLTKKMYRDTISKETTRIIYHYEKDTSGSLKVKEYRVNGRNKKKLIRWAKYNAKGLIKEEWEDNNWISYRYQYNERGEWTVKQVHTAVDLLGGMGSWQFKGEYRRSWTQE